MKHRISAEEYRKLHGLSPVKSNKKKPAQTKPVGYGKKEKDIQNAILGRLKFVKNGFFWRENSGMIKAEYKGKVRMWRSGIKGISDIMGIYNGIGVAIEVKRPGNKPTPFQIAFMERYSLCGGIAFVCDDDSKVLKQLEEAYQKGF